MSALARTALQARREPLRLVIFDCDGVLIDSEPIADRVVTEELAAIGWPITEAEVHTRFLGMRTPEMPPIIETILGRPLPEGWAAHVAQRMVDAMAHEAVLMAGATEALDAADALGLDWRVASNSGPRQLAAKFARTRLTERVAGRVFSANDIVAAGGRGKPAPDIFLAAAAHAGCASASCLVIEDSALGARGAIAAGMQCLGFDPAGDGSHLAAEGAVPLHSLFDLPDLLRLALQAPA
jgi:beta-phosphoglucomutase-like phosphatase (HAD superfamily)